MNWDRIEGNWKEWKGKIKEKWGQLPTTTWSKLPAAGISSSGSSSGATATRGTGRNGSSTS